MSYNYELILSNQIMPFIIKMRSSAKIQWSWSPNAVIFDFKNWRYSESIELSMFKQSWYYAGLDNNFAISAMLFSLFADYFESN